MSIAPSSDDLATDYLALHGAAAPRRILSMFEFWPDWLFYAPVALQWIALGLRYRDFTLPTAANPGLTAGGLVGETKSEVLDQVAPAARDLIAPYVMLISDPASPEHDLARAQLAMAQAGLGWPVVVKPDAGCNGTGVRLVADAAALGAYFAAFPRGVGYLLQAYVPWEGEAGLFYVREPGSPRGRLTSITLKYPPVVVGDGQRSLRRLVLEDPRAGLVPHLYLPRLAARLDSVPAAGERVQLVFVGNHCKGSIFRDGTGEVTPALTAAVERLAQAIPHFHFGRFDVRFASLAALRQGEGFRVIEINGTGSEATHVWDPSTTLLGAWRAELAHFGLAWRIGAANRARGARSTGSLALWRLWRRHKALMAAYPLND